jgi:Cupin-like domain
MPDLLRQEAPPPRRHQKQFRRACRSPSRALRPPRSQELSTSRKGFFSNFGEQKGVCAAGTPFFEALKRTGEFSKGQAPDFATLLRAALVTMARRRRAARAPEFSAAKARRHDANVEVDDAHSKVLVVAGFAGLAVVVLASWILGPLLAAPTQNAAQKKNAENRPGKCLRLDAAALTPEAFHDLVRSNRPAVIAGAAALDELKSAVENFRGGGEATTPATEWLLREHGAEALQVSLSKSEMFEGVELAEDWDGAERFWTLWRGGQSPREGAPPEVLSKPGLSRFEPCQHAGPDCMRHVLDRVVVRPAVTKASLRQMMTGDLPEGAASAYVQYEGIPASLRALVDTPAFAKALKPDFQGLWIGRGRTLAQLHYDANENILVMLRGTKRWRLFPPTSGNALHEGFMLEVQQRLHSAGHGGGAFDGGATKLGKDTVGLGNASLSFFTSPVSSESLDSARFPAVEATLATECVLNAGDMLFVPSWWWHSVDTTPETDSSGKPAWSAALNFWFEPLYVKDYACADCKLRRNPAYRAGPL